MTSTVGAQTEGWLHALEWRPSVSRRRAHVQLSSLSKSLVAAALALGSPLLDSRAEAAPVAAATTSTAWHFVRLDRLLAKLVPTPPDTVGLYLWSNNGVRTLRGPDFKTACPPTSASCKALRSGRANPAAERLLVVTKTGAPQWISWEVLRSVRADRASSLGTSAARDPELAALDHVLGNTAEFVASGELTVWIEQGAARASVVRNAIGTRLLAVFYGPPRIRSARPSRPNDHMQAQREHTRWVAAIRRDTTPLGTQFPTAAVVTTKSLDARYRKQFGKGLYELDPASTEVAGLPAHERAVIRVVRATPKALDGWVKWLPIAGGQIVGVLHTSYGCSRGRGMPPGMVPSVSVVIGDELVPIVQHTHDQVHPKFCHPHGRRPPGLAPPRRAPANPRGAFLADVAHLEAASVPAFVRLAAELAAFGAPSSLIERARAAAADEVRHASTMTTHARAAGSVPAAVEVTASPLRDAFAFALDNAVEGCVHEAFAAVLCRFQATTSSDPALAADLDLISEDEAAHGELAWAIARWIEPTLAPSDRAIIERARVAAADSLADRIQRELAPFALAAAPLGLPSAAQARALACGFAAALAA